MVQAAKRSGSLVTARYALEENRDVLAVPGSINNPRAKGSNNLIKDGAYLVDEVEDILAILPGAKKTPSSDTTDQPHSAADNLSEEQRAIVAMLKREGEVHYSKFPGYQNSPAMFSKSVLELELQGTIRRLPGNHLQLC